jgi:hypothetical protein
LSAAAFDGNNAFHDGNDDDASIWKYIPLQQTHHEDYDLCCFEDGQIRRHHYFEQKTQHQQQ